jgi:hypothetical protein
MTGVAGSGLDDAAALDARRRRRRRARARDQPEPQREPERRHDTAAGSKYTCTTWPCRARQATADSASKPT